MQQHKLSKSETKYVVTQHRRELLKMESKIRKALDIKVKKKPSKLKKIKPSQVKMAKLKPSYAKLFREASQKQSKRAIKDAVKMTKKLAKKVPYVGAAVLVHGVVKSISKATCSKRGGKWVSGKCKGVKKDTRKMTSPQARDLKSKR